MKRSKRAMRLRILAYLFRHLKALYNLDWPRKVFGTGEISEHDVDAMVAFKSDPHLDELHAALRRLEREKFGTCIRCSLDIDQTLLDDDPTRRLCAECEREMNRPPAEKMDSGGGSEIGLRGRQIKKVRRSA